MRQVEIQLFGALREAEPDARLVMSTLATTIGELRVDLQHRTAAWPDRARALITRSAFASSTTVLRDAQSLPEDGQLALLPPVSGG